MKCPGESNHTRAASRRTRYFHGIFYRFDPSGEKAVLLLPAAVIFESEIGASELIFSANVT